MGITMFDYSFVSLVNENSDKNEFDIHRFTHSFVKYVRFFFANYDMDHFWYNV